MQITYANKKLLKICTNRSTAIKQYGVKMANKIAQRISEISNFSLPHMQKVHVGRCHRLEGKREGQYAVDLIQPYRLVFKPEDECSNCVIIMEIIDYH